MSKNIRKLLVANRGEIAARIIATANELDIETYALVSGSDTSHSLSASHVVELDSPGSYLSVESILKLSQKHGVDAIHPGYGFLSESDALAREAEKAGILLIGPGEGILRRTGDKLAARRLAEECNVPCLPAMTEPTGDVQVLRRFAEQSGLPVMLKAVDGGGGRGIRLVRNLDDLPSATRLATNESPSKQVFAERAAVDGFRHIEVQIIGDGSGRVAHLFERECSIQRRYQKIVEIAPSTIRARNQRIVDRIIASAVSMAERVSYRSLGTFEFLANPQTDEFFFLEVNPRLQVEHTITEQISGGIDIVRAQLLIAQGKSLEEAFEGDIPQQPKGHAIQLRVTAENPKANWTLSIGRISGATFPSGNGIRVDTAIVSGRPITITSDFDSLIAKIITSASTWKACVAKAKRALSDTTVRGVETNLAVLQAIIASPDFGEHLTCDTQWLEGHLEELIPQGLKISETVHQRITSRNAGSIEEDGSSQALTGSSNTAVLLRKGDAWKIDVQGDDTNGKQQHHLKLERILRNELPSSLSAILTYATPSKPRPEPLRVTLTSTNASAGAVAGTSNQRRGDANNPAHVIIPFAGKLVEVMVEEGDYVKKDDVVCVVQQMKMELEVRAARAGRVKWVLETEEGEDVGEGVLACDLELEGDSKPRL